MQKQKLKAGDSQLFTAEPGNLIQAAEAKQVPPIALADVGTTFGFQVPVLKHNKKELAKLVFP